MWVSATDLPVSPGHPFYARLNAILDEAGFDRFVEEQCQPFYAPVMGRPSLPPGRYFRLLLLGYFEGLDSERGIAWRAADSLAVRSFVGLGLEVAAPDHSTISRTRRLIAVETHRAVFSWVQERLGAAGLLKGRTIAIDATTLEANAAMRSILRRDTGESYQEFLTRLAVASGIKTPTREALARLDRRADVGNTTSLVDTAIAAAEQIEAAHAASSTPGELAEIVADRGYHSNQMLVDLEAVAVRSYIAEPDRGRRDWTKSQAAQRPVYANRRRMRGARGKQLMRCRSQYVERSFAHMYDTGGLRRTHLRGHRNILKRLLVHAGAFNLGILMRKIFGRGTPRGLQGRRFDPRTLEFAGGTFFARVWRALTRSWCVPELTSKVPGTYSTLVLAW